MARSQPVGQGCTVLKRFDRSFEELNTDRETEMASNKAEQEELKSFWSQLVSYKGGKSGPT
jgi:hypothetical protein